MSLPRTHLSCPSASTRLLRKQLGQQGNSEQRGRERLILLNPRHMRSREDSRRGLPPQRLLSFLRFPLFAPPDSLLTAFPRNAPGRSASGAALLTPNGPAGQRPSLGAPPAPHLCPALALARPALPRTFFSGDRSCSSSRWPPESWQRQTCPRLVLKLVWGRLSGPISLINTCHHHLFFKVNAVFVTVPYNHHWLIGLSPRPDKYSVLPTFRLRLLFYPFSLC